ncbi:Gp138 family membrane-puncturing spike protein [Aquabacter sp. CN5-332]|uniref:Gp138 family membrane-puncturing spike protein n=1 Tax=Aquabacter sp. CN5-332 TaxID=3156608 RepID=UPI0032B5DBA0
MAGYQGSSTRRSLQEAIAAIIEAERRDMFTALPARVTAYDPGKQNGGMQPALKQTFGDQELTAPELQSVPLLHPRGGGFGIHFPMQAGDPVTLLFAGRSRDAFQSEGQSISNAPGRMHDLSDAVAIPGGYPDDAPMTGVNGTDFFAGSNDGKKGAKVTPGGKVSLTGGASGADKVIISAEGKIDLKGETGDSLLQIFRDFMVVFNAHLNGGAAVDSAYQAQVTALIAKLDGIKA